MLTFESEALGEQFQVKEPTRAELREVIFAVRALFQNRTHDTERRLFDLTAKLSGLDTSGLSPMDEVHLMDELSMFYFSKGNEGSKKKPSSPSESGSENTP